MSDKKNRLIVFCDFDGTITQKDLGDEVFKKFGKFEPYHTQLVSGKIGIKQYWHDLCGTIPSDISEDDIFKLAAETPVDPYFHDFVEYLEEEDIPMVVISDGFDSYITPILKREGLDHLPVLSNKLIFNDDQVKPHFPRASESCECMCASCKRNSMLSQTADDSIIVYIGDGYSDFCGAEHSDLIFAKRNLAAYCNKHRIPHHPFKTFFDIKRILSKLINENKLKQRNVSKVKRKQAFEIE